MSLVLSDIPDEIWVEVGSHLDHLSELRLCQALGYSGCLRCPDPWCILEVAQIDPVDFSYSPVQCFGVIAVYHGDGSISIHVDPTRCHGVTFAYHDDHDKFTVEMIAGPLVSRHLETLVNITEEMIKTGSPTEIILRNGETRCVVPLSEVNLSAGVTLVDQKTGHTFALTERPPKIAPRMFGVE